MSALPLSNSKVSGNSALKTKLESTLTGNDAGFQFTVIGEDAYLWNGSSFDKITTNGASHVRTVASDVPLEASLTDSDSLTIAAGNVTRNEFPLTPMWNYVVVYVGVMHDADTLTLEASWDGGTTWSIIDPISLLTGAQLGASGVIPGTADSRAYKMVVHKANRLGFTKTGANASIAFSFYPGI